MSSKEQGNETMKSTACLPLAVISFITHSKNFKKTVIYFDQIYSVMYFFMEFAIFTYKSKRELVMVNFNR